MQQAKKILEKKNNTKEDVAALKNMLLHLEDGYARVQENEKIYHRLLLQKEVEMKSIKDRMGGSGKSCKKCLEIEIHDSKLSTIANSPYNSIETGPSCHLSRRKSNSFSGLLQDSISSIGKNKQIKPIFQVGENKLIDELAFYKVKYALFEENISERDQKIKDAIKEVKRALASSPRNNGINMAIENILQILLTPIENVDLQLEECLF